MFLDIATIDGPPAAGKTTMAILLAKEFGLTHLDSGAIFRALTLFFMNEGVNLLDSDEVIKNLEQPTIKLTGDKIFLNDSDVSFEIRTPRVTKAVCLISNLPDVRKYVKELQLHAAEKGKVICDGRKVGFEVFPNAKVKFYLKANQKTRAFRRYREYVLKDATISFDEVYQDIIEREETEIANGILQIPENAIVLDNTYLSIEETFEIMQKYMV